MEPGLIASKGRLVGQSSPGVSEYRVLQVKELVSVCWCEGYVLGPLVGMAGPGATVGSRPLKTAGLLVIEAMSPSS